MQGLLLGLASGTACLASCAPALTPFILAQGQSLGHNFRLLAQFLLGRLAGYLVFATLAWVAGLALGAGRVNHLVPLGAVYVLLGGLMALYGFLPAGETCAASLALRLQARLAGPNSIVMPLSLGFLTGINLCPPFLLALAEAARTGSLGGSLWFFTTFFFGTSLFFLPFPVVGLLNRQPHFRLVARLAAGVLGVYYLLLGCSMLY